jgi:pimeloyl-ACP methyl ester carboxylesterase
VAATVEEYRQWLIGELEALGSPVDLVGHDWGGVHAVLVAMTRPDELGRKLSAAAQRPGLAVLATEDHYVGTDQMRRRAAERAGARIEVLEGLGHGWMGQDPARGADVLTRFWASLPG